MFPLFRRGLLLLLAALVAACSSPGAPEAEEAVAPTAAAASAGEPKLDPRNRSVLPDVSCLAPTWLVTAGPSPRCAIAFGRAAGALGLAPGGILAIVSLTHASTTGWLLPQATFALAYEPLPPDAEARVILVDETRRRALFAVGSQLWQVDTMTGAVLRRIDGPGGVIADLAWAARGTRIAVASDSGGPAALLDGEGKELRALPFDGRALHVALDASGTRAAVSNDVGGIALFDLPHEAPPGVLNPSLQPAAELAFAGDRLVVAGSDGVLRVIDARSAKDAKETSQADTGSPLVALAISADAHLAAVAGRDRVIRLYALPGATPTGQLAWHKAGVAQLGFGAASTLVSVDGDGELAVWDLGAMAR